MDEAFTGPRMERSLQRSRAPANFGSALAQLGKSRIELGTIRPIGIETERDDTGPPRQFKRKCGRELLVRSAIPSAICAWGYPRMLTFRHDAH
jgi:hypothetical protein